jgi:sugar lactone lactonase YvrE
MEAIAECVWPVAAQLGEGPMWCAAEQALWFVDIKGRRIHRYTASGERSSFETPEDAAFVFKARGGGLLCGLRPGLYRFTPATATFEPIARVDAAHPGNRLNDGYVDAAGRLWFGTMDDSHAEATGSLYRFAGQQLQCMDPGYVITNGPAMCPAGRVLYHVDTLRQCVFAFDVDATGALSNRRQFVAIEEEGVYPDGPAVDRDGNVWIALFGGRGVRCYSPQGRLLRTIQLPVAQCTKAAFGGPDLRDMYITTAAIGLAPADLARQPLAGGLFRIRVDVPGLPANQFGG